MLKKKKKEQQQKKKKIPTQFGSAVFFPPFLFRPLLGCHGSSLKGILIAF